MSRVVRVDVESVPHQRRTFVVDGPREKDRLLAHLLWVMREMTGKGHCDSFTVTVHDEGEGCDHE